MLSVANLRNPRIIDPSQEIRLWPLPIVRGNYPSVFKYLRTICTKEGKLGVQTWRVELGVEKKPVLGCLEQKSRPLNQPRLQPFYTYPT